MNQEQIWDKLYETNLTWKKQSSNLPNLLKNKKVLELGVGNGKTLLSILKQKPKSVFAIDFSQQALNSIPSTTKQKAHLLKADASSPPFPDSSFDIIVCYYILNNCNPKEQKLIFSECQRLLKNKGLLLFEDFSSKDFRAKEKRKDNLYKFYFTKEYLLNLFTNFKIKSLKESSFQPFKNSKEKREIFMAVLEKSVFEM